MAYEKFKTIRTIEQFYKDWNSDTYKSFTEKMKQHIYDDYVTDCKILQRDNFTCQHREGPNNECPICHNVPFYPKLTKHHIRARRNGGKDTVRNQITVCDGIHKRYEKKKGNLNFPKDAKHLQPRVRGQVFKPSKNEAFDWKLHRAEVKEIRKELKLKLSVRLEAIKNLPLEQRRWFELNIEEIIKLMKCLEVPYWKWKDYIQRD